MTSMAEFLYFFRCKHDVQTRIASTCNTTTTNDDDIDELLLLRCRRCCLQYNSLFERKDIYQQHTIYHHQYKKMGRAHIYGMSSNATI